MVQRIEAKNCEIAAKPEVDHPENGVGQISHAICFQKPFGETPNIEVLLTLGHLCICRNYHCRFNTSARS